MAWPWGEKWASSRVPFPSVAVSGLPRARIWPGERTTICGEPSLSSIFPWTRMSLPR